MTRLMLMIFVLIVVSACEESQNNSTQDEVALNSSTEYEAAPDSSTEYASTQQYREILRKDVLRISKCKVVDKMVTDLANAPAELIKNLPGDVREVWALKGCQNGIRKRVEISMITDQSSSYTIRLY